MVASLPASAQQPEPWQMNFQEAHSSLMEQMVTFHNFLLYLIFAISLFVLGLMLYAVFRFSEKRNPTPSRTTHNTMIEVLWSVIPIFLLVVIGLFSLPLLFNSDDTVDADLTVKVIGRQWYWSYEYPDHGDFTFDAFLIPDEEIKGDQVRLLSTDENLVLPIGKKVRVLVTSSDVLHAFAMPALGAKVDAVPGRTNEIWFDIDEVGMYYGQCSEICGAGHAFMPIAIQAVTQADFDAWVIEARERFAEAEDNLAPRPVRNELDDAAQNNASHRTSMTAHPSANLR
ncbi:MAG: cytochrome c oxidase subunit II [Alphaproteobacteria bacterium]|nr:cytochrome c oxidase subunit II [Alphaproteobacteria bacterium]